jgi:4-amino-4-deoxy-L-arabinose transferase-like glycosyltransferase
VVAPAIISLATAVRVGLIVQGWPELNSDEPTLGLMALHILHHGERPVFEYGQPYMGGIEAYLAALFFQVLGPTTFALRLGNVLLYDLFLATLYLLTSRLYSRTVAFVSLLVLSLGPE